MRPVVLPKMGYWLFPPPLGRLTSENRPQRGQFLPDLQAHNPAMGQNKVSLKTNLYSSYVATKKMVSAKCGEAKNGPLRSICSRRSLSPTGSWRWKIFRRFPQVYITSGDCTVTNTV